MSEKDANVQGLRERRQELTDSLDALDKKRTETVQANSFARARDRAGVTEHSAEETARLKDDEAAARAASRDARTELQRLDAEIESRPREGLGTRLGSAVRRVARRDR